MLPEHRIWNAHAELYLQRFGHETQYDDWYAAWAQSLPQGAAVLEWGCGPGIIAHKVLLARPDLHWLGLDVAPAMVEWARQHAPQAQFEVGMTLDPWPNGPFDGLVAGFLLPYLNDAELHHFILQTQKRLRPGGNGLISWLDCGKDESRTEINSQGEALMVHYRTTQWVEHNFSRVGLVLSHLPEYRESNRSKPTHRAAMVKHLKHGRHLATQQPKHPLSGNTSGGILP
jgi:SAM-dependent methyltransferase